MQAVTTVKNSIIVEAGLLPRASAKELFGGWVADHYAVVQVTIGNQSREQQFVLQDIYFDYSNWALSGLSAGVQIASSSTLPDYQRATTAGQISSIGAQQVRDGSKSASVFSPRNLVVNGLVLVGTVAGGYSFLASADAARGIAAFGNEFMPGLQKFWPDRRGDQEANVLIYGFQNKLVIAKEDPGKTYAFFPIARFLTSGLAKIYLKDPAVFFNPAELFLDPTITSVDKSNAANGSSVSGKCHSSDCKALSSLKATMTTILNTAVPGKTLSDIELLQDLVSPCYHGAYDKDTNPSGEETCRLEPKDSRLPDIRALKDTLAAASLNSVRIVVSGIMTVDVTQIPATITAISFDKQRDGKKSDEEGFWRDTATKKTGVITGKYLLNGKPQITKITLPAASTDKADTKGIEPKGDAVKSATTGDASSEGDTETESRTPDVDDFIDTTTFAAIDKGSTDAELHFTLKLKKTIPNGSKLTFRVAKTSAADSGSSDGGSSTSTTTDSMTIEYPVSYSASTTSPSPTHSSDTPEITKIDFGNSETAATWSKIATVIPGTLTGKDLKGGTVSVAAITVPGTENSKVADYIAANSIDTVSGKAADNSTLSFTLKVTKAVPPGTEMLFQVDAKDMDGKEQKSNKWPHTVPKTATRHKVAPARSRPAGKPNHKK